MKPLYAIFTIIFGLSILFYPKEINSFTSGSPGGKTGSSGDNSLCNSCHYAGTGSNATITSNIPANGYVPGQTYTITANIQQSGISKFGFEVTAEENNGNKSGTFMITNNLETQLTNNNNAVTHTFNGTTGQSGNKNWSFDWTAPSTGANQPITFYGAFIAANGDAQNSGDILHQFSLDVFEEIPTIVHKNNSELVDFKMINNSIIIQNPISNLLIYDISGKIYYNYKDLKQGQIISLNNLNKGTYFIKSLNENTNTNSYKSIIIL